MITLIQTIISSFLTSKVGQTKVPGFAQNVGELVTSKTNILGASPAVIYGLTLLASDPHDKIGHAYLIGGVALAAIKDAIVKIKRPE